MHVLHVICALLLGLGAALRLGADLFEFSLRILNAPPVPMPGWLPQSVAILFLAGALLSLPAQVRVAGDRSDRARPMLFAGAGALIAALLAAAAMVVIGLHGDFPMVATAAIRLTQGIGDQLGALPAMILLVGLIATAGGPGPGAGGLLAAPLTIIAAQALALQVSITGSTITAMLPMILAAAALMPALVASRRLPLALWPISAAIVSVFAIILFPGWLTPGELVVLLLVAAIVAGAVGYLGALQPRRAAWLERAVCDLGGLILGLAALHLASFLITAIPWIIDIKRMLSGQSPSIMLGATLLAYIVVAAFTAPLTALSLTLILIAAAYGAGIPADILVVGLAVAALQSTVTRGTAREPAGASDSIALPPRQAAWAQTLIMIIVIGLAVATTFGWI